MKASLPVLCFMLGFTLTESLMPQQPQPPDPPVSLILFTDRNVYVTGETVQFAACLFTDPGDAAYPGRVLYVELVTPEGRQVAGGKYFLQEGQGRGCLVIPAEILTGSYFIRAYTRSMRNTGPSCYPCVPLRLINPLKPELMATANTLTYENQPVEHFSMEKEGMITMYLDKASYKCRDSVKLTLGGDILKNPEIRAWCLTVVPSASLFLDMDPVVFARVRNGKDSTAGRERYYPDTRGISVSGKLADMDTGEPLADKLVTLSIVGDKDFSAGKTGRQGDFHFSMPAYRGSKDIFIAADETDGTRATILIENDFCTLPVSIPVSPFMQEADKDKTAYEMAVNYQVAAQYPVMTQGSVDSLPVINQPFYGEPSVTLMMDEYIQLPTLEEYFSELPLEVKIRENRGRKYFKFLSGEAGMILYNPLVMVDWVVVSNMQKVLELSPQKINRIEIVNQPYVKGNITFGGILSIISNEGDFAGIDLPSSGIFLDYDFFAPECLMAPGNAGVKNRPDPRNTLFWLSDIEPADGQETELSFTAGDTPGTWVALIRGIDINGQIWQHHVSFTVEIR